MLPAQPNQSLIDGLAVLQALATSPEPVGTRALARHLGCDATRVNRLLKTLAHLGLARQRVDRRYVAGPGIHLLAAQALGASRLLGASAQHLEPIARQGWRVSVGVLWRDQVCYLLHADPGRPLLAGVGATALYPARSSAIGLALLDAAGRWPADADARASRWSASVVVERAAPEDDAVGMVVAGGEAAIALSGRFTPATAPITLIEAAAAAITRDLESIRAPSP